MSGVSEGSPLPLKQTLKLLKVKIYFQFYPLSHIFVVGGLDVANRQTLDAYLNQQINLLHSSNPNQGIARARHWKLFMENMVTIDLARWDSDKMNGRTLIVQDDDIWTEVDSQSHLHLRSGCGDLCGSVIHLEGAHQLLSNHLYLIMEKTTWVTSVYGRKTEPRATIETWNMLVPADMKVGALLQRAKARAGRKKSQSTKSLEDKFFPNDERKISDMAWLNGTKLNVWP